MKELIKKSNPLMVFLIIILIVLLLSNWLDKDEENWTEFQCGYKCFTTKCEFFIEKWDKSYTNYIVQSSFLANDLTYHSKNVTAYECQKRANSYKKEINKNRLKINDWKSG